MVRLLENSRPVTELISEQSYSSPQSIALICAGHQVTYEQLNSEADRFAAYLANRGIQRGQSVAICMERSFHWIVAALGIMKSGAAYVPLDSAWPDSRLQVAMEDSGASLLVGPTTLLNRLGGSTRGIDPISDSASISTSHRVYRRVDPEMLAYVIYTSGSAGQPKGVEIRHGNLAHLVRWHLEAFNVTNQDRASHLAGLGFDAAVWEIWPHLCAGATLCLVDENIRSSPQLLQEWLVRERITISFVPTVLAEVMMEMEWPHTTSLRFLLTGGDTLQHGPTAKQPFDVVNNYGPTETTVVATSTVLRPSQIEKPTIGVPISGTSLYLLDKFGQAVLDGSEGEIYIGGGGVGRGYRGRSDLTELNFLPDPFAATPGARMYRTGDLGKRRPNGEIEFHGRSDRQLKIRGQRVELDEISSILRQYPGLDFATVIAHALPGGNQLVAYVLPNQNSQVPTSRQLQEYLQGRLPDYMIPTRFVRLRSLPTTPNGKIDRSLLPWPADDQSLDEGVATSPESAVAEKLLRLVQQILGKKIISADDNFFLSGGHSLLAMQLLMSIRDEFGVDVSLRQLFATPTAAGLASFIETAVAEKRASADQVPRVGAPLGAQDSDKERASAHVQRPWECVVLPQGVLAAHPSGSRSPFFWIHYPGVDLARELGENQPFFTVMLTADDLIPLGENPTIEVLGHCFLNKILATQPSGPYCLGGFCLGGVLAFEIASQLRNSGHEVSLLAMIESPSPPFVFPCDTLKAKARYFRYLIKRATKLSIRTSLGYLQERLHKALARASGRRPPQTAMRIIQETCEAAIVNYLPRPYGGEVLMVLAGVHPPHKNFVPGWQALIKNEIRALSLDAHHRDFETKMVAASLAKILASQIALAETGANYPRSPSNTSPDRQTPLNGRLAHV